MKQYDLLNEVAKEGRIPALTLSVYLVSEVEFGRFIRPEVVVSSNVKIVQARCLLGTKKGVGEFAAEGFIYVSVPKSQSLGEIIHVTGALSPVTFGDYNPELALFQFAKVDGKWILRSCKHKPFEDIPYTEAEVIENLKAWQSYPFVLTTASSLVYPRTCEFDKEVLYSVSDELVGSTVELSKPDLGFGLVLTSIQQAVLEDMLTFPVLQLQVENEEIIPADKLGDDIKTRLTSRSVRVFDLRGRTLNMTDVLEKLKSMGLSDSQQYILLVSKVTEGIPYIQIGQER